ncbi:MAG: hypothetical protein IKS19_06565 [Clostridia bacterium]|nr:hypothetical protein [Clostridia bacterium]
MKKKALCIVFTAACLIMCIIPFAGMTVARTDYTTENKRLAELPALLENGSLNTGFMKQAGEYFEDRFAFRRQLVTTDAEIQSRLFGVSNTDTVIKGTGGWLYYSATLGDYLGKTMSEREIDNIVHNLCITQNYAELHEIKFLFTIAPNKNSLYGDDMPYYDRLRIGTQRSSDILEQKLSGQGISYLDLFELFENQDETLYLMRDSHWNNKGALLAYNAMMDALDKEHDDYSGAVARRSRTEYGDLNKMLYPLSAQPEWNYYYQTDGFSYATPTNSVEEAWIQTTGEKEKAAGTLLMYRDSFGNTLIPFMAGEFGSAYFSKLTPFDFAADIETCRPEYIIIEKVERNIGDLATDPPVIPAYQVINTDNPQKSKTAATMNISESEANNKYLEISGELDESVAQTDAQIYLVIETEGCKEVYAAFHTTTDNTDYGYLAYLPKDVPTDGSAKASVIVKSGGTTQTVCVKTLVI